jgi:hypothetical protein
MTAHNVVTGTCVYDNIATVIFWFRARMTRVGY